MSAFADLDEIWEFIAADNLSAADGVLEEIYEAIGALVPFPHLGHGRPESFFQGTAFSARARFSNRLRAR
jgi:plasmid stabilization system protein ParE